jgi:hypothetical protein
VFERVQGEREFLRDPIVGGVIDREAPAGFQLPFAARTSLCAFRQPGDDRLLGESNVSALWNHTQRAGS